MLVVVKTGATEIHQKLPIHFSTTLSCIPHFVIYSDLEENIHGHEVHDVLASISADTKASNKDLAFYKRLQDSHRAGRHPSTLQGKDIGQLAWNLDKWKFIPMMDHALRYASSPSTKWFFFIEADTAVIWDTIFAFVSRFDPDQPWYMGSPAWIGDVEFAHGGTGWLMSRPAVEAVARQWRDDQAGVEELVARPENWAGECSLAQLLKKADIGLTHAWPILQGETPSSLDYTENHWCFPVGTYHHVNETWVTDIWEFGEEWAGGHEDVKKEPMRHRDAFDHFVYPHLAPERRGWDNLCKGGDAVTLKSVEECRKMCEARPACLQWSFKVGKWWSFKGGECRSADVVQLGESKEGAEEMVSGWMMDRVDQFRERLKGCEGRDYWVP
ncbi:uncharacterized protein EI97DRAFT_428902 [Westerdykella ornata]|uniref:Glycosyltransferase family 31 protein n=1 Tax=Westerdykella ornata TaxID=318751 RepID=A0A6A6JYH6_WESOR|nr:uncharacterized protein EI97DRAFT_428902 [Westerdykella ornata]KAF2280806.1 hypothetical protein EI97DRAFT_428902 [Westerdykella ornata]